MKKKDKNLKLHGIAIENIAKGDLVEFDLTSGNIQRDFKRKTFKFYRKPEDSFNLKSDDVKK